MFTVSDGGIFQTFGRADITHHGLAGMEADTDMKIRSPLSGNRSAIQVWKSLALAAMARR
jgi:hypothetical protein